MMKEQTAVSVMSERPDTTEYRIRAVTRYIVTRYRHGAGSEALGEFPNGEMAYAVGYALASKKPSAAHCRPETSG